MNFFNKTTVTALLAFSLLLAPLHAQTTPSTVVLENGVTFVPVVNRTAPRVAFSIVARVGANDETAADAGWRRLLVNAMLRSAPRGYEDTGESGGESLALAAEKAGGEVGASVGDDVIEIYAEGDSARATELLRLALALLERPRLSDDDIAKARERLELRSEAEEFSLEAQVNDAIREQVFKDQSGAPIAYGLPEFGTANSLRSLSNDEIRGRLARLQTARLFVGASGDLEVATLRGVLENLPERPMIKDFVPAFVPLKADGSVFAVRELPISVAGVFISFPLGAIAPEDAPALRVLSAALGDARESRLETRLLSPAFARDSAEVASFNAQWTPRRFGSDLLLSAQTDAGGVDKVKNALIDEALKLKTTPLDTRTLTRAKVFARGSWSLERQNVRESAYLAASAPALGESADSTFPARLEAVSASDVQRVARKYLNGYAVVLIMPREREQVGDE